MLSQTSNLDQTQQNTRQCAFHISRASLTPQNANSPHPVLTTQPTSILSQLCPSGILLSDITQLLQAYSGQCVCSCTPRGTSPSFCCCCCRCHTTLYLSFSPHTHSNLFLHTPDTNHQHTQIQRKMNKMTTRVLVVAMCLLALATLASAARELKRIKPASPVEPALTIDVPFFQLTKKDGEPWRIKAPGVDTTGGCGRKRMCLLEELLHLLAVDSRRLNFGLVQPPTPQTSPATVNTNAGCGGTLVNVKHPAGETNVNTACKSAKVDVTAAGTKTNVVAASG